MDQNRNPRTGFAIYSRRTLRQYDLIAHRLFNHFIWRCPTRLIQRLYDKQTRAHHMEIGVGSGLFLDQLPHDFRFRELTITDANPDCLQTSAQHLTRFQPRSAAFNLRDPDPFGFLPDDAFDSVGLNYVLHCLPEAIGNLPGVLRSLRPKLRPGAVLFGSTILCADIQLPWLTRNWMNYYQRLTIFGNQFDSKHELLKCLQREFRDVAICPKGCVAMFAARGS